MKEKANTMNNQMKSRVALDDTHELACEGGATELFVLTGFTNHEAQSLYHAMGYEDDRLAVCKTLLGE